MNSVPLNSLEDPPPCKSAKPNLWNAALAFQLLSTIGLLLSSTAFGAEVTTNSNSGAGSYRQAIADVNAGTNDPSKIEFTSGQSILLLSDLPAIVNSDLGLIESASPSTVSGGGSWNAFMVGPPTSGTLDVVLSGVTYENAPQATIESASVIFESGGLSATQIQIDSSQFAFDPTATFGGVGNTITTSGSNPVINLRSGSAAVAGSWVLSTDTWFQSQDRLYLSGDISGAGALKVADSGAVALGGNNTYSGGTTLLYGTLELVSGSTLGSGDVDVHTGTTLHVSTGTPTSTLSNTFNIIEDYYAPSIWIEIDASTTTTLSGDINGLSEVSVNKTGDGILALSGTNTFGSLVIEDGEVIAESNGALGSGTTVLSNNGVTLSFSGTHTLSNDLQFESGGTAPILNVSSGGDVATLTGAFSDASFTKTGPGTVVTTNVNSSYTSAITIAEGSLQVEGAEATLGSGEITIDATGALGARGATNEELSNSIVLNATTTSDPSFTLDTANLTLSGIVSGSGVFFLQGQSGTELLTIPAGTENTFTGNVKVEHGALLSDANGLGDGTTVTLTNDGGFWFGSACALSDRTLVIAGSDSGFLDPNGFNAAFPSSSGSGTLALSNESGNPGYITGWISSSFSVVDPLSLYVDATGGSVSLTSNQVLTTPSSTPLFNLDKPISSTDDTTIISIQNCRSGDYKVVSTEVLGAGEIEVFTAELNIGSASLVSGSLPDTVLEDSILSLRESLDLSGTQLTSNLVNETSNVVSHDDGSSTSTLGSLRGSAFTFTSGTFNLNADNSLYSSTINLSANTGLGFQNVLGGGQGQIVALGSNTFSFPTTGTVANSIALDTDTTFTVSPSIVAEIDQSLSGGGTLLKTGAGNLVLRGNNTHNGLQISVGILNIAEDSNVGSTSAPVELAGGRLQFGGSAQLNSQRTVSVTAVSVLDTLSNNPSIAGPLNGASALSKVGSGRLTYSGDGTGYTATFTAAEGTTDVRGTLGGAGAEVLVSSGAVLTGTGTVRKAHVSGSINSVSTSALSVVEDLEMVTGSSMGTAVKPKASSNFEVGQTATVAGTLNSEIRNDGGAFIIGAQYPIVTASSVEGRFTKVNLTGDVADSNPPTTVALNRNANCCIDTCCGDDCCPEEISTVRTQGTAEFELVYTDTQVYLQVLKGSFPAGRPLCCPSKGVYDYLITYSPAGDEDLEFVYGELATLRGCQFDDALVEISPINWDGMVQSAQELVIMNQTLVSERVGLVAHTPCEDRSSGMKGWIGAIGGVIARHSSEGFSGWSSGAVQAGIGTDYSNEAWRVGASFTYGRDHLSWTDCVGSGDYKTYGGTLYGSWTGDEAYIYGSAYGAGTSIEGRRDICFGEVNRIACNEHNGAAYALRLGLGWQARWDQMAVIPYIDGDLTGVHEGRWTEHGASSLNLTVFSRTVHYGRASVGVAVAGCRGDSDRGLEAILGLGYTYQAPFHDPCIGSQFGCSSDAPCMLLPGNQRTQQWCSPMLTLKWHALSKWDILLQANANLGSAIKTATGLAQIVYRF